MNLIEVGYFSKAHGIKGGLVLREQIDFDWEKLTVLFVEVSGGKAPYFVSALTKANQGFILQLEQIDQIEKANQLLSKKVFIDAALLIEDEEENTWLNYQVIDHQFGDLGLVKEVSDNGIQKILEIEYKGKLILLPFVDELIDKIDDTKKTIHYKSPEGLIDLYLEDEEEK